MKIEDLKVKDIRNRGPAYCHDANLLLIKYCRASHNQTTLDLLQEAVTEWPTNIGDDDEEFHQSLTHLDQLHDQLNDDPPKQAQDLLKNLIKVNDEYLVKRYCSVLVGVGSRLPCWEENKSGDEAVINATIEIGAEDIEPEQFATAKPHRRLSEEGPEIEMPNDGECMFPNAITDITVEIDLGGESDDLVEIDLEGECDEYMEEDDSEDNDQDMCDEI